MISSLYYFRAAFDGTRTVPFLQPTFLTLNSSPHFQFLDLRFKITSYFCWSQRNGWYFVSIIYALHFFISKGHFYKGLYKGYYYYRKLFRRLGLTYSGTTGQLMFSRQDIVYKPYVHKHRFDSFSIVWWTLYPTWHQMSFYYNILYQITNNMSSWDILKRP